MSEPSNRRDNGLQKIAYLTGEYPRATDTFIQREVFALRSGGLQVETFSIRRTAASHHVGIEQQAEAATTHYLLPAGPVQVLRNHVAAILRNPKGYFAAIRLAWQTKPPGLKATIYQACYFIESALVVSLMRRLNCQHLHNHFANSSCSVAMLASTMGGFPYSITMHGPAIFFEPKWWRIDKKIETASLVACISHFCRSQAMAFSDPAHWHKLRIVHCGVEPDRYTPREHTGRGTRLTYVGRLAAVKGLPILLRALSRLAPDIHLSVVGDGPDSEWLKRSAEELGVSDRVDFLGYKSQDEVADILSQTDVFVMSSFAEGVPVVLMEAMASGVPVVATAVAGIGELVSANISGFLVPPGDEEELAERLFELIEEPQLRQRFGDAGRQKVSQDFNIESEGEWLAELFQHTFASEVADMKNRRSTRNLRPKTLVNVNADTKAKN